MKKITTTLVAGILVAMTACKKEETIPTPDPNSDPTPDGTALNSFFSTNKTNMKQSFTFDASNGAYLTGAKGTTLYISPNSLLDPSNTVVTGNVTLELIEIYDRASMVLANKATVGILPNGDHATLKSGGEYYLNITQNGVQLHTNGTILVNLPVSNTGALDMAMNVFRGMAAENNDILWELDANDTINIGQDSSGTSYGILDGEWGWTNVDRFYSDPDPKTVIRAKLPTGYDLSNCEVFVTYDGEPTALAKLDVFTTDGYFSEHYGLIPIGKQVHFIAVTMIDNQLYYAIHGATITDGYIENISDFQAISQADLAVLINNLP